MMSLNMPEGNIGLFFTILFAVIVIVLAFLEIKARYKAKHGRSGNEIKILRKQNFPDIQKFLADKRFAEEAGFVYYDYFLFAIAPTPGKSRLVRYTNYYSSRYVPDSEPLGSGAPIVWIFGGSNMQNIETTDELTIANQVAVGLKRSDKPATVVNFGVLGFQSTLESIKFQELLRLVPAHERPSVVLFYDGFNDAGLATRLRAGSYQNDLVMKMEALIEGHHGKMFIYSLANLLGRFSAYWRNRMGYKFTDKLFGGKYIKYNRDNMAKGVEIYETNSRIIRGVCREFGIKPVFILQPMIYTKNPLTEFERKVCLAPDNVKLVFMKEFYQLASKTMKPYDDFHDLSGLLDGRTEDDFYDMGHIGPYTGIFIGEHIAKVLESYLPGPGKR